MTSPIDRLIDEACGVTPGTEFPTVTMRCPDCRKTKTAPRHDYDPVGTAVVECQCLECGQGNKPGVRYFDSEGNELDLH